MVVIGILFFIFGFITWLNSVLIPYLKIACELNNFESYLVAFAFYIAYFFLALPSGIILSRIGYKNGMSVGLLVMASGALLFIPAAMTRTYLLFLTGLFVMGSGLALLQTAANPYVTVLGPLRTAARRISIMGVCNKTAGAIAPILIGSIALKDADSIHDRLLRAGMAERTRELDALAARVITPYIIIVIALAALAFLIWRSGLPEIGADRDKEIANPKAAHQKITDFPHLWLGVVALFLYVGVEVLAGDSIISYGASQGIPLSTAKFFTTCTLVGMIAGYVCGIALIPKYLSQEQALRACALLGILFSLAALFTHGYVSVFFIALLGLANSLMWPTIWPLSLNGLGTLAGIGSSLLVMGIAGGALLPLLYGWLADIADPRSAYWLLLPCYVFILYYALAGYRKRK